MKKNSRMHLFLATIATLALAAACGDDPSYKSGGQVCGAGQEIDLDEEKFCIFEQTIIEEGFRCPDARPNRFDFDGFTACGSSESLPGDFEARARQEAGLENAPDPEPEQRPDPEPGMTPSPETDPAPDVMGEEESFEGECPDGELLPLPPEDAQVVFLGAAVVGDGFSADPATTLETDDEWEAFKATLGIYGATTEQDLEFSGFVPDFEANRVVAVEHSVTNTCGDIPATVLIGAIGDVGHVEATFRHPDGLCESVCEAEGHALSIVQIPRIGEAPPTICRRIIRSCEM